jgi:hypothetical protein
MDAIKMTSLNTKIIYREINPVAIGHIIRSLANCVRFCDICVAAKTRYRWTGNAVGNYWVVIICNIAYNATLSKSKYNLRCNRFGRRTSTKCHYSEVWIDVDTPSGQRSSKGGPAIWALLMFPNTTSFLLWRSCSTMAQLPWPSKMSQAHLFSSKSTYRNHEIRNSTWLTPVHCRFSDLHLRST